MITSEEINALPEELRRFIHDLETRCDPAGEVRALAAARENADALAARVKELQSRRDNEALSKAWEEGFRAGFGQGGVNPYRDTPVPDTNKPAEKPYCERLVSGISFASMERKKPQTT